ncbi:hypothetical protein P171DRAFT_401874 [Karstenula rhodostoma CBS 690.94]|uniref:DUF7708 domain-containing protein n=1 Tax=Karstenula rhodostoma CBS 690.94 TaxID=1392251 RepID=A0A9P4UIQ7_9PLEO|nr:hypothetical protein P171DRAFT_401874 [Karstenula rhodostoma CBS 690.94]
MSHTASVAVISTTTSSWYLASLNASSGPQTTFEESLARFKKKLASHSEKRTRIDSLQATTLQDVVTEVAKARAIYDKKKGDSKTSKLIVSFSQRVAYYGKVLDVMVQHHPEYVSLAWGSLKLVFGAVVEHERLGSTIVAALNDVGEALSRIDLAESLYPTDQMKSTIVALNCHIITFLCRALDWYESSSFSRAVQSIARPAALRYDDLIKEINKTLAQVTGLSVAGSQAEQRDMHEEMRIEQESQRKFRSLMQNRLDEMQHQLNALVRQKSSEGDLKAVHSELRDLATLIHAISGAQTSSERTILQELVVMKQDIQATQADISHQISDVQLNQALSIISSNCRIDHKVTYENSFLLRRVRLASSNKCAPFWNAPQLQLWDRSLSHSSIVLSSTFRDRLNVRDFYIGVIEQLLQSQVPVLWIIEQKNIKYTIFDVLKSLIAQALAKAASLNTDVLLSPRLRAFHSAHSVEDYTLLLVETLSQFDLIYIVADANAVSAETIEEYREVLWKVPRMLRERKQDTKVKIMLAGHGLSREPSGAERETTIRIAPTSKRKSKRVPKAPLKGRRRVVTVR